MPSIASPLNGRLVLVGPSDARADLAAMLCEAGVTGVAGHGGWMPEQRPGETVDALVVVPGPHALDDVRAAARALADCDVAVVAIGPAAEASALAAAGAHVCIDPSGFRAAGLRHALEQAALRRRLERRTARLGGAAADVGNALRDREFERLRRAEDELRESRERLQAALDGSGGGTFRWDIRTNALDWDDNLDRLFGLEPGKTVRSLDKFIELVHPDERDGVVQRCRRCATEGADFDMEFRVVWPDGTVRWLDDKGKTFRVDGRPAYMTGMCLDITPRKQALQALRDSEGFYRQTVESVPGMTFTNRPDGWCDYVSEQWVRFTGVDAARHLGDGWVQRLHPDDRARATAAWNEAVAGRGRYDIEYRVRRHDGVYEWFKVRGTAIRDSAGRIARWFGMAVNVNDLKLAESALRRREHELRTLTDNSPDVLTRFDRELRHVFVSGAIERATGRSRDAFIGRTNRELGMPAPLCEQWEAALRAAFETGERQQLDFAYVQGGAPHHYSGQLVPEFGPDGRVEHVIGVTHDRTLERTATLALEEASRRKDEFLATLAHELRNPLAPIRNGLLVLQRMHEPERMERVIAMMERQLAHMVHLIDDLLDVSRISSGKVVLQIERVSLQSVLEMAVEATRPFIEAGRHALSMELPGDDIPINADATRMSQVFSNLLTNAAKYTAEGGRIGVRARAGDGQVVIDVSDNGAGIPADMLDEVFAMFAQVNRTLDRAQGGLGIGLALVRRLVEMHGGSVSAASPGLGLGSTFTVTLPVAKAPATAGDLLAGVPPMATDGGRRILVVDDNVDAAESLSMLLQLSGHEVHVANDGAAALDAAGSLAPDVAFIDIGLPGISGHEVARRWRQRAGSGGTVLVAVTGWGTDEDKRRAAESGFHHHLTKPVDPRQVDALLRGDGWSALRARAATADAASGLGAMMVGDPALPPRGAVAARIGPT